MALGVEAIIDVLAPGASIFSLFRILISRDTGVGFLITLRAHVGAADRRRHEKRNILSSLVAPCTWMLIIFTPLERSRRTPGTSTLLDETGCDMDQVHVVVTFSNPYFS